MQVKLHWVGAFLVLGGVLPACAAEPPKEEGDKPEATNAAGEKHISLEPVAGLLKSVGGSQKNLIVHVSIKYLEANPQAGQTLAREQQDLLNRQRQILRTRNPVQRQREMIELLQHVQKMQRTQQDLFRIKEMHKDVELKAGDDMKVRSLQPPLAYDEKGYPKKYSKDELKELRGDGNLPGYATDMDYFHEGQIVVAYVPRKQPADKADSKESGEAKPLVTLLVVVGDTGKAG